MKLTLILIFAGILQVSASVYSQQTKISFNFKDKSVKEVLDQIEASTDFRFFYNENFTDLKREVTIEAKNNRVEEILDVLLASSDVTYRVLDNNLIVITPKTLVQQQRVTGKVTDANTEEPLPGVYVRIEGSNTGAVTDADGNYAVDVPLQNAVLQFSFIGYNTETIPVSGRLQIDVAMVPELTELEEVVVVGYGTQKKVTVTGAITTVGSEDVQGSPVTKLTDGLAGKLSGVIINQRGGEPGRSTTDIYIRGRSTTDDDAVSPLYVIDGIVRDYSGLDRLDANEIESITILKDASAAIYGSRAANGVVLITTKRGKVGKPVLEFSYNHGFSEPTRLPATASAGQYAETVNLRQEIYGFTPTYTDEQIQKYYDGSDPVNYPNTDWYDLAFKDWKSQDKVNLSASGGTENIRYFISGGYINQGSPYDESFTYNRQYNFRTNIDATITKNLTVSMDVGGRLDDILSSKVDYWHIVLGYPTVRAINPNGTYPNARTGQNALMMIRDKEYGYKSTDGGVITSSLSAAWKLPWVEGLSLTGTFAYDYNKTYEKDYLGVTYLYNYNSVDETYTKQMGSRTSTPQLTVAFAQGRSITANMRLAYVKSFGQHNIDAFLGYEQNQTHFDNLSATRKEFMSGSIHELFAGTTDNNKHENTGSADNTARQHVFGRVQYDYARKYMLQIQMRYDGSQNFPKDNRWGLFPGISAGWTISEESFMKGLSALNYLKLRASWGKMGNDKVGAYQYLSSYGYGETTSNAWTGETTYTPYFYTFGGIPTQAIEVTNTRNTNITWEVATTTDIGLEARFWNQLLGIDVDVFYTKRNNILAKRNASVPDYTGLVLPNENIGVVDNRGIEINLTHRNNIGANWSYNIGGNFTYVKNKVIDVDEVPNAEPYQDLTGHPVGASLLYECIGVFDDAADLASYPSLPGTKPGMLKLKDANNDGILNSNDQVRQDWTSTPEITYGLNAGINYKQFSLNLNFQGQARARIAGFQFFPYDPVDWGNFNPYLLENGWTPENTDGTKPAPIGTFSNSINGTSFMYFSSAFLRLKNAELSYNLPKSLVSKVKFTNCRIYVSVYNLFSIDELKKLSVDPETTNFGTPPPDRIINLGISLTL